MSRIRAESDAKRLVEVGHSGWYLVDSKSKNAGDLIALLQADPDVAQAAGDVIGSAPGRTEAVVHKPKRPRPFTDIIPNDPGFPNEWGLLNTGQTINNVSGIAGADIDIEGAWSRSPDPVTVTTGTGGDAYASVALAVVDSGIDATVDDLAGNLWSAPEAYTITIQGNVYNCSQGSHGFSAISGAAGCSGQEGVDDLALGHGTQDASILGAVGNNGEGMTGAAWGTQMISIRVLDSNGLAPETTVQTGIDALEQIMSTFGGVAPVGVIDLDVVFSGPTPGLETSIQQAAALGLVTVSPTGNECHTSADYPAFYRTTGEIAVAGSDQLDEPMILGPGDCTNPGGQVAAPAKNIETIEPGGDIGPNCSGTSAAAPFVSAAAGLLMHMCPLTPNAVVATLEGTAMLVTDLQPFADQGQRLDVGAAIASCKDAALGGSGSVTVSLGQGQGLYDSYGTVTVMVDGTPYAYNYDTFSDDTDSIGQALANALTNKYLSVNYEGGGVISIAATALGAFTNYGLSASVTHSCDGPIRECDPYPRVQASGTSLTGGTGPTRPQ